MKKVVVFLLFTIILATNLFAQTKQSNPQVIITTSAGKIVVELFPDKAPKTVENFINYVKTNFYDNLIFHRVINGFMIQGGGFNKDLVQSNPKSAVVIESDNGLKNERGTIAMARTADPNSATSQFFINHKDNPFLNFKAKTAAGYGYTVFGKVISGMDVVDKIAAVKTGSHKGYNDVPTVPITINSIKIKSN